MRISGVSIAAVNDHWCRLELATDGGLVGAAPCRQQHGAVAAALARDHLRGQDPRGVATLWDRLTDAAVRGGLPLEARASLDLACWDLKARANAEPLWKTLGSSRPGAMAYASPRCLPAAADLMAWFETMAQAGGFRWGCLPLSGNAEADAERLGRLREILAVPGGRVELLVDAGGAGPADTIRLLQALEQDFDIACVKGVGAGGDLLGNRQVADSIRAAVCAGGELAVESAFQPWLHEQAANVIELDLQRLGITGAQRVAEAAFGFELPVLLRAAPGNLHAQLAGALPNCMALEAVASHQGGDACAADVGFSAGRAVVGDRPGLGLHWGSAGSGHGLAGAGA